MTPLPSLEEPDPGTRCPVCREPVRMVGYCGACQERDADEDELRDEIQEEARP